MDSPCPPDNPHGPDFTVKQPVHRVAESVFRGGHTAGGGAWPCGRQEGLCLHTSCTRVCFLLCKIKEQLAGRVVRPSLLTMTRPCITRGREQGEPGKEADTRSLLSSVWGEPLAPTFALILAHREKGLSRHLSGKEPTCHCRRCGLDPWVGKISWRRAWQPTPVFLPGESHGQRSLVGYSPWGHKESDTTERTEHALIDRSNHARLTPLSQTSA